MFSACTSFNTPIKKWNISKGLKFIQNMFKGCPIEVKIKAQLSATPTLV